MNNIVVRNDTALSSGTARTGRQWTGTMVNDLSVNGKVVAPAGSKVRGRISDAESSGKLSNPGILALELTSVNGIPVTTDMYAADGEGHTKNNIKKVAGGAGLGAMLGSILGGAKVLPSAQQRVEALEQLVPPRLERRKRQSLPSQR